MLAWRRGDGLINGPKLGAQVWGLRFTALERHNEAPPMILLCTWDLKCAC